MHEIGGFLVHVGNMAFIIRTYALPIQGSELQNRADLSVLENVQSLSISSLPYSDDRGLSCCVARSYSKVSSRITNA